MSGAIDKYRAVRRSVRAFIHTDYMQLAFRYCWERSEEEQGKVTERCDAGTEREIGARPGFSGGIHRTGDSPEVSNRARLEAIRNSPCREGDAYGVFEPGSDL